MEVILNVLFVVEVSYALVGLDLLRKWRKTRGLPELFLGLAFVSNGLSYFFTDFPIRTGNDAILDEFSYIGRIFAGFCALAIAGFDRWVFRPDARWASWMFWAVVALLLAGAVVSALEGDWEGAYPLSYTGVWFEWLGGVVPFVWLAIECLGAYARARRRLSIGLGDPLVVNRLLLIGIFGVLASLTYPLYVWMYVQYERYGFWSDPLVVCAGVVEVISLLALWTSFTAPAFYRRWIGGAPASS